MKYNFDQIINRKGTYSCKWDLMPSPAPKDALPLWVADMDFPCAQPIIDAIHERTDNLIFGYTYYYGNEDILNSVTGWFKRRYEWDVPKENIFFSPGIVCAVAFLINILTEEGDGIIIQPPVYHPFAMKIRNNQRKTVVNPLLYKDGYYSIDFDGLEKLLLEPENKGLIFCNPHNPGGRVWTKDELKKVAELCKKYNKWVISDEIHSDILRKGYQFTPLEKIAPEYKENIITCTSPSKTFNIAGLLLSNIVINKEEYKKKYIDFVGDRLSVGEVSPMAISAAIAAYDKGEEWLDQVKEYIDENIELCMEFFKNELPKATVVYPEATYLVWVDLRNYCADKNALEEIICHKAKLALNQGYIFGESGEGFVRINAACPRSILQECLNRIKKAFSDTPSL